MKDHKMKASLRALASKLSPFNKSAPSVAAIPSPVAPLAETDDDPEVAYDAAMAENLINQMTDRIELLNGQVRALVKVNHELTAQLAKSTGTLKQFYALPRNRYWSQRSGK